MSDSVLANQILDINALISNLWLALIAGIVIAIQLSKMIDLLLGVIFDTVIRREKKEDSKTLT